MDAVQKSLPMLDVYKFTQLFCQFTLACHGQEPQRRARTMRSFVLAAVKEACTCGASRYSTPLHSTRKL